MALTEDYWRFGKVVACGRCSYVEVPLYYNGKPWPPTSLHRSHSTPWAGYNAGYPFFSQ